MKVTQLPLQRIENGVTWRRLPFPRIRLPRDFVSARPLKSARKETVPLQRIIAGQDGVTEQGVQKYLRRGRAKLPVLIKSGDNYLIRDGHHRLTADYLRGARHVNARVVDVAQMTRLHGLEMNPLLELTAKVRLHQFRAGDDPARLRYLRARPQGEKQESFLSRHKYRIAGTAAAIGVAAGLAKVTDKGMGMAVNPHRSITDQIMGRKSPAAIGWEKEQLAKARLARAKTPKPAKKAGGPSPAPAHVRDTLAPLGRRKMEPDKPRGARSPEQMKRISDYLFRRYEKTGSPRWLKATLAKGSKTALPTFNPQRGDPAKRAAQIGRLRKRLNLSAGQPAVQFARGDYAVPFLRRAAPESRLGELVKAARARNLLTRGKRSLIASEIKRDRRVNENLRRLLRGGLATLTRRRALVHVKRTGSIAQDVGDVIERRPRQPGKKREWEKSWFKNAVAGAALGVGLWGAPRVYAHEVKRRTGATIGTTAIDALQHATGAARAKIAAVRAARRVKFSTERLRLQFDTMAAMRGWDVRDPRGRSARVYAPGSRRRERREKTEWEKVATIRRVRNALAIAALAGAGATGYLAHQNVNLRRKLTPKAATPGNLVAHNFRKSS